ncbi:hypothetical protein PAN31117_01027 [Pandoraea anapnoica]|uniref:Uncharacterized protein n=1 Tax=Pandoraea anapnoica TaxID=2508301 RepID=A0A5E4ZR91_9BURK|nr:hypothetical protein [Pandoraea anapnoica]VVE62825.1 hypothetical protein PAN31117_01027 [Pandoraea anapnoica]
MPPRHVTPCTRVCPPGVCLLNHDRRRRPDILRWLTLLAIGLLATMAAPHVQAQSMPPSTAKPADAFHQPCVAVRAVPNESARDVSGAARAFVLTSRVSTLHKQYVDLDDRCATPPAFAPTRDVDSTSVWYVDAPAAGVHAPSRHPGALTLHGVTS